MSEFLQVTIAERQLMRELAAKVSEIGHAPIQQQRAAMWSEHNQLRRQRPMILVFPEGSWRELLPDTVLQSKSPLARRLEWNLRSRLYYAEHLADDNVIEPVMHTPLIHAYVGWGLACQQTQSSEATGANHYEKVINSEDDLEKLTPPVVGAIDWDATRAHEQFYQDLFGDILRIERQGAFRGGICAMDEYAKLRGIDNMFMDLFDNPALVHAAIRHLVDGNIVIMQAMEAQGILTLGNRNHYAGSGGTSYTTELPQADFDSKNVRCKDLWGFATSQIFSEVSPAMLEEFALQHERRYLELFGLNCYACCEPVHDRFDIIFRNVPRLRRLSISPWTDIDKSAERLGANYIYSWKPNPALLAGESWNPQKIRAQLHDFCQRTRNNVVEIIMKDTHTVRNHPQRMWEWVRIAQEVAAQY